MFRKRIRGAVMTPADAAFDQSREIWNRLHDRRPALVVRPASSADVTLAVRFAQEHRMEIAIKGGGHHAAGYAATEGGMLLDMAGLRTIEVNPENRRVRAQAGLTWAQFDQVTQAFGLACTGPIVSMTGIAGFTLGGGMGWLHRRIGLACDSLRAAEVVTADGNLVATSETKNPDLFWGMRGGGWNFGAVTSMEFEAHPIGPVVVAGLMYFPLDRFPELVERHRLLKSRFPDELTTWFFLRLAPPAPVIPKEWVGRPVAAIALCHCGPLDDGKAWADEFASFGNPIANTTAPIEYRAWQRSLDARWGNGFYNDWRGHYFDDLQPEAVRILVDYTSQLKSPWSDIKIPHLGGAVRRVAETETAYGNRNAEFGLVIQARWENAADSTNQTGWAKELRDALAPHATGGVYANFIAADERDRVPLAHGAENYRRLQELKLKYDPENVFRGNPNVTPAKSGGN
jgi:FAD/FMN-containing dehydrogenase